MVQAYKKRTAEEEAKKKAERREEKDKYQRGRKERKARNDPDISSSEPDSSEERQKKEDAIPQEEKDKKAKEYEVKLLNNAKKYATTYDQIIRGFKSGRFKKVIVCTGAGISVSAGIPDFRSPKTGLYDNLSKYDLPNPQAIFEINFFNEKPGAFYQLADEFLDNDKFNPTATHYFIKLLQEKGIL